MGLRPTQNDEERWWRELQLAASASAGELAANFGLFFSGVVLPADRSFNRSIRVQPERATALGEVHAHRITAISSSA